jgi:GTPase SAR1 family protein
MIRGCRIGFLVFDVAHLQSLDNLISYWIPMIERNAGLKFHRGDGRRFILVGNKIDLLEPDFSNVEEEMKQFSEGYGTGCQMISAKTGVGIEQLDFKTRELVDQFLD